MAKKTGPSAPPAGLFEDIERAEHDKLDDEALADLLAAHRAGDPTAGKRLTEGLRYVPYGFYQRSRWSPRRSAEDVLGTLFTEYGTAIGCLSQNDTSAEGVVGYLCGYLEHATTHFMAEIDSSICPPPSTNADRIAAGKEPYVALRRRPEGRSMYTDATSGDDVGDGTTPLDEPPAAPPAGQDGKPYHDPYSCEPTLWERLDRAAETDEEREFVDLLLQGETRKTIARRMGMSRRKLDALRERLVRRAAKEAEWQW
jgi:hypothetical protein